MKAPTDKLLMRHAIALANSPAYSVLPNPRVGAVIVRKGKVVGKGFHRGPGLPHGEVEAIRNAEKKGIKNFKDCEIFISLEPCCHSGKRTPPCAPVLIAKKFKRVVVASLDPNPKVSGRGMKALKKAGIKTSVGILTKEAERLNQDFFKNQKMKLPYVTLKIATTFDGKMADDFGRSKWITSDLARNEVHRFRSLSDAISVGRKTIDSDNPSLNIRIAGAPASKNKVVIFGKPSKPLSKLKVAQANGLENIYVISSATPLKKALQSLYKEGICHLFLEGGPQLASAFLKAGLVDQLLIFQGKGLLGGKGSHAIGQGWGLKRLEKSIKFTPESVQKIGPDILIRGLLHVYRTSTK